MSSHVPALFPISFSHSPDMLVVYAGREAVNVTPRKLDVHERVGAGNISRIVKTCIT